MTWRKLFEVAVADRIPMYEAETRVLGASHAEVGAYLLGLWGLLVSHRLKLSPATTRRRAYGSASSMC